MTDFEEACAFYDEKVSPLRGHTQPTEAYFSMYLLNAQNTRNIGGNLLEIGVLAGRYLALMARFVRSGETAFGIDTFKFHGINADMVMAALEGIGCADTVEIRTARSDFLSPAAYRAEFGPVRFLHIDGSHLFEDMLLDLAVAEAVLEKGGIVGLDDFFHQFFMGVTEAVFRYFEKTPGSTLVPFAFCTKKLFLCRSDDADDYAETTATFLKKYVRVDARDRGTPLLGREIPVIMEGQLDKRSFRPKTPS